MNPDLPQSQLLRMLEQLLDRAHERVWVELDETWQILAAKRGCRR